MRRIGDGPWSVSTMIDRVEFPGTGLDGGSPGATGEFIVNESARPQPKAIVPLDANARVQLNLPGGGGCGNPFDRDPARVLDDVVNGYISIDAAAREYGVAVRYLGTQDQLVRLPKDFAIVEDETKRLRSAAR